MSQPKTILQSAAAVILWLVTAALGLADVYFVRELFFAVYARLAKDNAPALFWGDMLVVLAAVGFVAFLIASGEYHRKHVGERKSWRLFAWSLAVMLAIPIIALLLGGSA